MAMKMLMIMCKQVQAAPLLQIPTGAHGGNSSSGRIDFSSVFRCRTVQKEKVVVVMGATGTGKSRLSIDLATRCYPGEIINSDKIQVYEGLNIATNKISEDECDGVPHHLLGIIDPEAEFTATNFVSSASIVMESITGRGKLPIIAGGSNSFIEALIDDYDFRLKYDCCFLWVDVSIPVLHRFVSDRVDRMVASGMVGEVRRMFNPNGDYTRGIRKAIGVPEFDKYFRAEYSDSTDEKTRQKLLEEAIEETKINTCKLACRQLEKIHRLRNIKGWNIHRLDATEVFQQRGGSEADKAWEELVTEAAMTVYEFLYNLDQPRLYTAVEPPRGTAAMVASIL